MNPGGIINEATATASSLPLHADDLLRLPEGALLTTTLAICHEMERLAALRVAAVATIEGRPVSLDTLGFRSIKQWLAANTLLEVSAAGRIVALGRALDRHPEIADAFHAGTVSGDHAKLIAQFCDTPPRGMPNEALDSCRQVLLDAATGPTATTDTVRGVIAKLERIFESDELPASEDSERNEFHASKTLNGRVSVKGDFDAVTGEMLLTALSALTKPTNSVEDPAGMRSPGQRRADAFTEILRRYLDTGTAPVEGCEKPHLFLHINANDLAHTERDHAGRATHAHAHAHADAGASAGAERARNGAEGTGGAGTGRRAESGGAGVDGVAAGYTGAGEVGPFRAHPITEPDLFGDKNIAWTPWMGPLTVATARRLACDCHLTPVVIDDGIPLDLGRTTRTVSKKQRRALIARDHGCAFPGCGTPPAHCEGHHIHHWADGGPTDLDNLVLLCRHHHRLLHHSHWDVKIGTDRHPWFTPPSTVDPYKKPIAAHGRAGPRAA